jgi:monoterpene epsilon-lactone hydrolase
MFSCLCIVWPLSTLFPAGVNDALEAYEFLLRQGWRGDQISVAGDSAGAGLTLALLLALRDRERPMPKCAVVYSPYADVTLTLPQPTSQ